jgi:hypothetical protein
MKMMKNSCSVILNWTKTLFEEDDVVTTIPEVAFEADAEDSDFDYFGYIK